MRRMLGGWTATSTVMAGGVLLALALYGRAGEAQAPLTVAPSTARRNAPPAQASAGPAPRQAAASTARTVDFEKQIRPILEENCLECHSADKRKGGLSLAAYADVLDGGRSGAVVQPGHAAASLLLARVQGEVGDQMPLKESPLTDGEIATLRRWVDQGARRRRSSPPAPTPWEAPLALTRADGAGGRVAPVERPCGSPGRGLSRQGQGSSTGARLPMPRSRGARISTSGVCCRRRTSCRRFSRTDLRTSGIGSSRRCSTTTTRYAEHWISFWNDLLRNDDGQTYFSDAEGGGRQSITPYLLKALTDNTPYNEMLARLINPTEPGDPAGFIIGVNWRGETSAAVTPWMQASQNTAQAFLGVNFKCNACHDSFVSKWKLKDAYGLAAYFSPEPTLQLYRCDIARDEYTEPSFFFPELARRCRRPLAGRPPRHARRDLHGPAQRPDARARS